MNNYTSLGVIIGLLLAFAVVFGTWELLLVLIAFAALGGVIGAHFDGRINLKEIASSIVGKGQG